MTSCCPRPNGSTISAVLAEAGAEVVAASLRNRAAVAAWLVDWLESSSGARAQPAVVVVPAGERWPDDSLRPAVEDLWGAGSVVAALAQRLEHRGGPLLLSPEAEAAGAAWLAVEDRIGEALHACASGRELVEQGWPDDVAVAAELDASDVVPVLTGRRLHPAHGAVTEACRTRGAAWLICHRSVASAGGSVTRHELPRPFGDRPRRRRRRRRWPSARR